MTQIIEIPLADLHESPSNPRTFYDDAALLELAEDIKGHGRILQPLLVRPRVPALFAGDPDAMAGYEIVFGHRRFRAALLAGATTAPCMVRSMTDEEVKRAQISENLQRVDVHPIEEAEGFQALINEHNLTADLIAAQQGKSRSYVYSRLKLLALCPPVRKACIAGEIGSEVGLLIARVGSHKLQEKALGYIKAKYYSLEDGGAKSYRQIRDLLNERFTLGLATALFPIEDEMLVPEAGHCMRCPKRSGNAPEFNDVVAGNAKSSKHFNGHLRNTGPDICTDPDCFDTKKKAHLAREAKKLEAGGKVVIGGNRARSLVSAYGELKGGYIPIKEVPAELKGSAAGHMGAVINRVIIQDPRTGKTHEAVKLEEVKARAEKMGIKAPEEKAPSNNGGGNYNSPESKAQREEEAKRNRIKLDAENKHRRDLLNRVRLAADAQPRSTFDLRLAVSALIDALDHQDSALLAELHFVDEPETLIERLDQLTADQLGALLLDCLLVKDAICPQIYWINDKPQHLLAAAKHYGVPEDAPTPSTAAHAPKNAKAAAGAKKPEAQRPAAPAAKKPKTKGQSSQTKPADAGQEVTDDAGPAGGCPAQADLLATTEA